MVPVNAPVPKRPLAHAVKSLLFSAHAPRLLSKTPSTALDAHAVLVPLANAPVTVLLLRTPLPAAPHALADLVLLVAALVRRLPMVASTLPTRSTLPPRNKCLTLMTGINENNMH